MLNIFKLFQRTVSDEELIRVTKLLYNKSWNDSVLTVRDEFDEKEAYLYAKALSKEKGWRQRVSGAAIVYTYQIKDLVPPYINSFSETPETHTCYAFLNMLAFLDNEAKHKYQSKMKGMCSSDAHGNHLISLIEKAANV